MATFWTNRGARRALAILFQGEAAPADFYVALVKASPAPTADTVTMASLSEITAGNGYTAGGIQLNRDSVDFDTLNENTTDDLAEALIRDLVWTASGGAIPSSGDGARYAVLTDDDGTLSAREVWIVFDLTSARTVSTGQALTLRDLTIQGLAG